MDLDSRAFVTPISKSRFFKLSLKKNIKSCPPKAQSLESLYKRTEPIKIPKNDDREKANKSKSLSPVRSANFYCETPPFVTKSRPVYKKNESSYNSSNTFTDNNNRELNLDKSNKLDKVEIIEEKIASEESDSESEHLEIAKDFQVNDEIPENKFSTPQNTLVRNNLSPISTKIMNSLYGNVWVTTPGLLKKTAKRFTSNDNFKPLNFDADENDLANKLTNLSISTKKDSEPLQKYSVCDSEENSLIVIKTKKHNQRKISSSSNESDDDCEKLKKQIREEIRKINKPLTATYDLTSSPEPPDTIQKKTQVKRKIKSKSQSDKENINIIETKSRLDPQRKPVRCYGFIASLGDSVPPSQRHPRASLYKDNFKSKKEELTRVLFKLYNRNVFESQLPNDLVITWNNSLTKTAGMAQNKIIKNADKTRDSRVELSVKVLDSAFKLSQTLAHELCHVATWLIDGQLRDGHGSYWKSWINKTLQRYPELGSLPRCHSFDIKYKFTYTCVKCGYNIGRHSKSIDTDRKRCGYCYGRFELSVNKVKKDGIIVSTPVKEKKPVTGFALFVKENYGNVRSGNTPHKEAMKYLGKKYAMEKQKQGSNSDNND